MYKLTFSFLSRKLGVFFPIQTAFQSKQREDRLYDCTSGTLIITAALKFACYIFPFQKTPRRWPPNPFDGTYTSVACKGVTPSGRIKDRNFTSFAGFCDLGLFQTFSIIAVFVFIKT